MDKEYKLVISGHEYTVKLVSDMSPYFKPAGITPGESDLLGFHNGTNNEIIVYNRLCKQRREETLLHETVHALLFSSGIQHEELLAQIIANNLMQLGFGPVLWKRLIAK